MLIKKAGIIYRIEDAMRGLTRCDHILSYDNFYTQVEADLKRVVLKNIKY